LVLRWVHYGIGDYMIFFTADEHLGHSNRAGGIISMCKRPFSSLEEMTEEFVARHNAKVRPGDTVIHVGDMFWWKWTTLQCKQYMTRLNGYHIYYNGNHEEVFNRSDSKNLNVMFLDIKDVGMIEVGKQLIWVSHYAHRVWPKSHEGSYHVFGHCHGVLPDYRRSHDVGVDANNFAPVSFDELDVLMKSKGVLAPDEIEQDILNNPWPSDAGSALGEGLKLDHLPEGSY
jgi:calcineurin-like phosphoesterase family protein